MTKPSPHQQKHHSHERSPNKDAELDFETRNPVNTNLRTHPLKQCIVGPDSCMQASGGEPRV